MPHTSITLLTPKDALNALLEENRRYATNCFAHPHCSAEHRVQLTRGQHPYAVVIGCSDSRVPTEVIFDQGLGDIFVIRTAGNVVDELAIGSVEYAVAHLGCPLVMILGHTQCGAVSAALNEEAAPGRIGAVLDPIRPALEATRHEPGDPVDNAAKANAQHVARHLRETGPILSAAVIQQRTEIVAAFYDLETGRVEILPDAS